MKVLCYGVREVEKPFFEKINENFNYDLTLVPDYLNSLETASLAKGHEAVILRGNCNANKEVLDLYKEYGVKYLLTRTVGINHIDVKYAKQLGFIMGYVPFYSPNAVSELAVTHALMLARNMSYTTNNTSKKDFRVDEKMFAKEIRNSVVGVVGIGRIGLTTAKLFKGLGAEVLAYDAFKKDGVDEICKQVSLDELLEKSDIVSLHCPYIKENGRIVTSEFISKMKNGAILINTSRGELQDIEAIVEAIENNKLKGVGFDVLENETEIFFKDLKQQQLSPIFEKLVSLYPRVLISPHIGSYTDEAVKNMIETSFVNLKQAIENGEVKFPIQ